MTCLKGHLFCKACIIENLFMQKQEIKKKIKKQKEELSKNNNLDKINEEKLNKIENFKKVEDGLGESHELQCEENVKLLKLLFSLIKINLRNDEINRFKEILEIRERKKIFSNGEKIEIIKNCFWVPEKTPEIKNNNQKEFFE